MSAQSHDIHYRLNVRFLGWLLLTFVVAGVGVYFLHRFQETRLKDRYLTQADQAKNDNKTDHELQYLAQYIGLNPNDTATRVRYGLAMARYHSKNPRMANEAYYVLQKALQNDPEVSPDVRLYCVRLALKPEINQPNEARRDLEILLKNNPDSVEYADLYSEALIRAADYGAAETFLTSTTQKHKNRIDSYARLANLKKQRSKSDGSAEIVIQQMLQYPENATSARAWLRVAGYRRLHGTDAECDKAIAEARRLAPDDAEVLYAAGERRLAAWRAGLQPGVAPQVTPDFTEGVALLERAIQNFGTIPPVDPFPEYGTDDYKKLEMAASMFRGISQAYTAAERYDDAEKYAREQVRRFSDYLPLQLELLDVLVRKKQYAEAEKICVKMENAAFAPALVELQRGFMAAGQDRWIEASRHLERTIAEIAGLPDLSRRANLMLAICYERTGEVHRVYETLQKAVPVNIADPTWASTKLSLAATMARLGLTQNAISAYKDVAERDDPRAIPPLLALLFAERAKQTGPGGVDAEIHRYLPKVQSGPMSEVIQANLERARKETDAARQRLVRAVERYPDSLAVYLGLFDGDLRDKKLTEAAEVLAKTEAKFGDTYDIRRMKLSLVAAQSGGDAALAPELEKIAAGLEQGKLNPTERVNLLKMLSFAARSMNRLDLASTWLDRAAALQGENDIDTHYQRFDLAVLKNDDAAVEKVLADIERISGSRENPSFRLAYAFSLIYQAERLKENVADRTMLLERAQETLALLEQTRKDWGRLSLAQAKVADMLGKRDIAITKYRHAIDQGERQPEVFRRLADLYRLARNSEAVSQLVSKYPESSAYLEMHNRQVVAALIGTGDFAKALELARKAVPEDSKDPKDLLWLAQVLNSCGQSKAAEAPLKRALSFTPDNASLWLVYLQTLVHNKKKDEARAYLDSTHAKLNPADTDLALAQAWTLLNELEKSRELYKKLLEQRPDSIVVLRHAGGFFFAMQDYPQAGKLMEQILAHAAKTPADIDVARRTLAYCTVVNRDHNDGVRILGILGFKTADAAVDFEGKETLDDLRCRFAVLSAIRGRAARMATAKILRELELKSNLLSIDQQLAYAQIQFVLGDWIDSKRRFLIATTGADTGATAHAMYAGALLRKGDLDEARRQIDRVVKLEPDSQRTMELVARHAVLADRKHEAVEAVRKFSTKSGALPEVAAMILEQLGLPADAEAFYRRAAESTTKPELRLLYAGYLARQGRTPESIGEFEKVLALPTPPAAAVFVPILCEATLHISPVANPAVVQKIVNLVEAETKKNAKLKPYLAALYSIIDRVPEGITLSQDVLASDPNNVFTLNNLAFMIAMKDSKYDDAIALIRKAVGIIGPLPTLLDTEASILIAQGRSKDAIEKLKEVILDEPSASAYMHLAQAYLAAGLVNEAKQALSEAKKYNLRMNDFHPLERQRLIDVLNQLEK